MIEGRHTKTEMRKLRGEELRHERERGSFSLKPGCHLCNFLHNLVRNYALAGTFTNAKLCFYDSNGQTNT